MKASDISDSISVMQQACSFILEHTEILTPGSFELRVKLLQSARVLSRELEKIDLPLKT